MSLSTNRAWYKSKREGEIGKKSGKSEKSKKGKSRLAVSRGARQARKARKGYQLDGREKPEKEISSSF